MVRCVLALVLLNALLSFNNIWPTLLVKPDTRLAPEAVLVWVFALAWVWRYGANGRWLSTILAVAVAVLAVGRYWDVTVNAVFGRDISLYWDIQEGARLLSVAMDVADPATMFAAVLLTLLAAGAFFGAIFLLTHTIVRSVPGALGSPIVMVTTALAGALVISNMIGVQATWPYISKPILPDYAGQVRLIFTSASNDRLTRALPASPPMSADLATLAQADVKVLFLESYGIASYNVEKIRQAVAPSREAFADAVASYGLDVVSAFVTPPTFAGGSGLSHMSLLAGIDTTDPFRYHLLLTSDRPTLLSAFRQHDYETIGVGLYSGRTPESGFYRFDHLYGAQDLQYGGPDIGLWKVPDQFAMARVAQWHPPAREGPSRFVFFPTLASHLPFSPTPPVQDDWLALTGSVLTQSSGTRNKTPVDWNNLGPAYGRSLVYTFDWLSSFLGQEHPRGCVLILIGDHQPMSSVSGPNAAWEVPVHIVTDNTKILERLKVAGFVAGINPDYRPIGRLHELTLVLLDAFSSSDEDLTQANAWQVPD